MAQNNQTQLRDYLKSILPHNSLESLAVDLEAPIRMTGTMPVSMSRAEKAHAAVRKLEAGQTITKREELLIEAIIIPHKRPAVLIQQGTFEVKHTDWLHLNEEKYRSKIEHTIRAVGRVEIPDHPNERAYAGTAFLVAADLMMTNRHVAEFFSTGVGIKQLNLIPGQAVNVDLLKEAHNPGTLVLNVDEVAMVHPTWDMALLRVSNVPTSIPVLTLSMNAPEEFVGKQIAAIGYPAFDSRNDASVQQEVFNNIFDVKRLQPGIARATMRMTHMGSSIDAGRHDASTLGGNSGSCVIDLETGDVIALHFGGKYLKENYTVPSWELSRDNFVVDMGVEFGEDGDNNVETPNPFADSWHVADSPSEGSQPRNLNANPQMAQTQVSQSGNSVSITIPVTITATIGANGISLTTDGQGQTDLLTADANAVIVEKMVEPIHDANYAKKTGYNPEFLGINVPPPVSTNDADLSISDTGEAVLHYTHFSLAMNKHRRLAQWTAANVDTNPNSLKPDPSKRYDRRSLNGFKSKWDKERWFLDPRIPGNHQLPDKFFDKDRKSFDKGHLVRRKAIVWGATYKEVQDANGDSFHATNCSPQVGNFNRSQLRGIWGRLENNIFSQAKTEKLNVFAGPIFHENDPIFTGVDDDGAIKVKIPKAYWKVITAVGNGKLQSFAFILEQDISDVDFEFIVEEEWKDHQISLSDLEKRLGNTVFDKLLHDADQFEPATG